MADKDTKNTHKATQPKAKEEYSLPNDLKEALDDLESYEKFSTDLKMNSVDGDRMHTEKHKPVDGDPGLEPFDKDVSEENIRENEGESVNKEVKKIHEEAPFTAVTNLATAAAHDINDPSTWGSTSTDICENCKRPTDTVGHAMKCNRPKVASDRTMDLERKIKDSNKSKGGVKYHGDSGQGESRRKPRTDKYKNIDRTKINDVVAALEDVEAFGKLEG